MYVNQGSTFFQSTMGDHGYAGLSKPTKPGLSSAPTGMLKEEVLDELEKRLVHDETVHIQPPRKPTAIEIELDMTKPILVYRYPTKREDSYDKAMQELKNKFENPLNIAAHLIKRGLTPRRTKADQLESVKASLNALQRVKNIFETENVDMYTFALTCTFTRSMTPSMEESWDKFRIQEMHHYHEKRDLGVKAGEFLPEWKFGLVDNYEKFNAWLEKQEAQLKKDDIERRSDQLSSLCRESTNQEEIETPKVDFFCFLCGPKNSNHHLTRCPVGLDMSLKDWVLALTPGKLVQDPVPEHPGNLRWINVPDPHDVVHLKTQPVKKIHILAQEQEVPCPRVDIKDIEWSLN
eukprot:TCALIF_11920-PA protein Name:"Protein of unknown function" AED:0.27 eAED:0.27 QI:0/0/0/0.75/0.66/0.75/4/0/348